MAVRKISKKIASSFKKNKHYILPATLSVFLLILTVITYQVLMLDKFYPITYVGDQNISFLSTSQSREKISKAFEKRSSQKIYFNSSENNFSIDLATSEAKIDYSSLDSEFENQKKGKFFHLTKLLYPSISLDIQKQVDEIAKNIETEPENAQLLFNEISEGTPSANIQIKEGKNGIALDRLTLEKEVSNFLLFGKYSVNLPTKSIPPKVTSDFVIRAKEALESLQKESIKLKFDGSVWILDVKQAVALLDLQNGSQDLLDKDRTHLFLSKISGEIDTDVQEGLFEFNTQTKRVTSFKSSQEGRHLDIEKTYSLIIASFSGSGPKDIQLPVEIIKPKTQTQDVNSLGIKELIGRGISYFAGSIPNRSFNVALTATKINGVLVAPDEIFSFNKTVGDITAATGFKQAYVIKEGRTVLDDGGGVCQDSTTLFRAVLNAGLPIVKRTAHAYRVGYYEQGFPPGLDATVYYPSVDFQFKNDTRHHILIQSYTVGTTLYMDLYGTSDGRISSLSKPVVYDQTPAPPELRQDDPTLAKGTVKQVDFAAKGAKVTFNRTVTRNGEEIIKEIWNSFYKPWQAVYLVGTKE